VKRLRPQPTAAASPTSPERHGRTLPERLRVDRDPSPSRGVGPDEERRRTIDWVG
jgi:hypothetical protein